MTKKMLKKVLSLLLAALILCSLCACGEKSETNADDTDNKDKPYIPGLAIDKVVSANYTSEFPYLFVNDHVEWLYINYITETGDAYTADVNGHKLIGNNAIKVNEHILYADGTVNTYEYLSNIVEIEWGDVYDNNTQLIALRNDGTLYIQDYYNGHSDFYKAKEWTDIIAVSAATWHLVGLKSDGTVVATGNNSSGACNTESWKDIIAIGTATGATYGVKKNGTVVTTEEGYDVSGWSDIVAISAADNYVMGLKADGTVVTSGEDHNGETKVSSWTDIVALQACDDFSVGIKSDGTVISAGDDYIISKCLKDVKIKVD